MPRAISLVLRLTLLLLCSGAARAAPHVRIVEPAEDELLFGATRISVEVKGSEVAAVAYHLDAYPRPICVTRMPPHTCRFDAGTDFQPRTIRVLALAAGGAIVAEDVVETLAFPRPERIVRRTLEVPVVARAPRETAVDLQAAEITCSFAGDPCRAVSVTRLGERQAFPVSLEILVDVSGSVDANRGELYQTLVRVVEELPVSVRVATTEFAGTYARLGGFTSDPAEIREAMLKLGSSGSKTCLVSALKRSLATLQAIPGHKLLFVISDGEENCSVRGNTRQGGLAYQDALYDVVQASRNVSVPIYIYSYEDLSLGHVPRSSFARSYEGLAAETGGRLFGRSNVTDLRTALERLMKDLESTWVVDLDLPPVRHEDWKRRLVLEVPGERGLRLLYPEYWEAESREEALIRMLGSSEEQVRLWSASRTRANGSARLLRSLLRALEHEPEQAIRVQQIQAIQRITPGLLIHGDPEDQQAAVTGIERLCEIDTGLLGPLRPFLRVYPKLRPPPRLLKRLKRCASFVG